MTKFRRSFLERSLQYFLGLFMVGLGVNMLFRSQLGAGAWDTVTYNLATFVNQWLGEGTLTLGMSSFMIQSTLLLLVLIGRRSWRYLFILMPIFTMSLFIDFWDLLVFQDYYPQLLSLRFVFYVLGVSVLILGLVLVILTRFPAAIFDEVMLLFMSLFRSNNVFVIRLGVEFFAIGLAVVLGIVGGFGLGAVNVGSVILAVILPPVLALQLKTMGRWFDAYEKI